MSVAAAGREKHRSSPEAPRFALDPTKPISIIDDQVVPGVLAKRFGHDEVPRMQRKDHCQRCAIPLVFRVIHS
jgi:hypothetical protein